MFFVAVILIASIIQTSTGFGFSILATPFLLFLMEPRDAIQLNLIVSIVISCALINKIKNDIDFGVLKRFLIGSVVGLPIGMAILLLVDMEKLKLGIGVMVLALTILLMIHLRIKQTKARDTVVGSLSGTLTSSIGMPGPPMLLYFSGIETKKESVRATTTAFYLIIYPLSLIVQIIFVGTNKTIWISSSLAIPIVAVGLVLGQFLFAKINQRIFRLITYGILFFTGAYLLIESIVS